MKIEKLELVNLHNVVRKLTAVDGELRYKMIDNNVALRKAVREYEDEKKAIEEMVKDEVGLTEEKMRVADAIELKHLGTSDPLSQEEQDAAIAVKLFNRLYKKDMDVKAAEEVEVDVKCVTLEELKKITKDEKLTLEAESLLIEYLVG